jgi:DNA-binding CsgD family transcriptional regulator
MTYLKDIFIKTRYITLYGLIMAVFVFALKWFQWKFLVLENATEIYAGLIAVSFTLLGIWVATQLAKPKIEKVVVEKEVYITVPVEVEINEAELKKLNLSSREHEVLQLLTKGQSNTEIAENLFLSLSTVKTHVSNVFIKMDVKSRAQAIEKAKRLKITH